MGRLEPAELATGIAAAACRQLAGMSNDPYADLAAVELHKPAKGDGLSFWAWFAREPDDQ